MTRSDIIHYRLLNQRLVGSTFTKPQEVVNWLVAMQSQEFAMAKWAIGLRATGLKDLDVERSFNEGLILRTHVMRPTWHFVSPADIRWLVTLTAPRIRMQMGTMNKKLKVDAKVQSKSNDVLIRSLAGGKFLTRIELQVALKKANIIASGERLGLIMMNAELDLIVCSGPRIGKQFTYALLDERAPVTNSLSKEETLFMFAQRYFASRWPASVYDFAYWSGLTIKDAKTAAASLPQDFKTEIMNGNEMIVQASQGLLSKKDKLTYLMPDYDEYGMSYKDREAIMPAATGKKATPLSYHMIVIDGQIGGSWRRVEKGARTEVKTAPFFPLSTSKQIAVERAVKKYLAFQATAK